MLDSIPRNNVAKRNAIIEGAALELPLFSAWGVLDRKRGLNVMVASKGGRRRKDKSAKMIKGIYKNRYTYKGYALVPAFTGVRKTCRYYDRCRTLAITEVRVARREVSLEARAPGASVRGRDAGFGRGRD